MDDDSEAETDDIYQAAWYKLAGARYLGKRKAGSKVWFKFRRLDGPIGPLREQFFSGEGTVVVFDYSKELKRFKELVFTD